MSKHGLIRAERPAPTRAKLIALLIEERATVIHVRSCYGCPHSMWNEAPSAEHRDQARREIEAEVLTKAKP